MEYFWNRCTKKYCLWCGEDLSQFVNKDHYNTFINCPCCNNQYFCDEIYFDSYELERAVNYKLMRDIINQRKE